jgi:hypothetical protein
VQICAKSSSLEDSLILEISFARYSSPILDRIQFSKSRRLKWKSSEVLSIFFILLEKTRRLVA